MLPRKPLLTACMHALKYQNQQPSSTLSIVIDAQIPQLVKAGYRVVTPDLRGALGGGSDLPQEPAEYHIEKQIVKDVAGWSKPTVLHALHSLHGDAACA